MVQLQSIYCIVYVMINVYYLLFNMYLLYFLDNYICYLTH